MTFSTKHRIAMIVSAGKTICTITLSVVAVTLICSCAKQRNAVDLRRQISGHEARNYENWKYLNKKPLIERIVPAPDLLLDYLRLDQKLNGFAGVPKAPSDWRSLADDVRAVISNLPAPVQKHLEAHVVGVFIVTDLGSTAYSDALRDFQTHKQGFIVLDMAALGKSPDSWATWRETTPFNMSPDIKISLSISEKQIDRRMQEISFILVHEIGHLVGAASNAHPLWSTGGNPSAHSFSTLSWSATDRRIVSKYDEPFVNRDRVKFYAGPTARLESEVIPELYANLVKTDFVSLYASTSMYEDFAETYAMYVHVVMQKRPWQLQLEKDGVVISEIMTPILQERCAAKKRYIEILMR